MCSLDTVRIRRGLALLTLTAGATYPMPAHAERPLTAAPRFGVAVGLVGGYVRQLRPPVASLSGPPERDRDSPRVGLDLRLHYRFVQAAVLLDLGGAVLGSDRFTSAAGAVGVQFAFGRVRLDALGVAGVHWYTGVGASWGLGIGADDPGVGGSLPFLGARVGASYEWGRDLRFGLGLVGFLEEDLARRVLTPSVTIGETQVGAMLRVFVSGGR